MKEMIVQIVLCLMAGMLVVLLFSILVSIIKVQVVAAAREIVNLYFERRLKMLKDMDEQLTSNGPSANRARGSSFN
jgi:predicted secreted Zn-dependent protease